MFIYVRPHNPNTDWFIFFKNAFFPRFFFYIFISLASSVLQESKQASMIQSIIIYIFSAFSGILKTHQLFQKRQNNKTMKRISSCSHIIVRN